MTESPFYIDTMVLQGTKYSFGPANSKYSDPICRGELVQIVEAGHGVNEEDEGDQKSSSPKHFWTICSFMQYGMDSASQQKVVVEQWMPQWSPGREKRLWKQKSILEILPLEGKNHSQRMAKAKNMIKGWEEKAPHHLAFGKANAPAAGKTIPLMAEWKNMETTTEPNQAIGLAPGSSYSIDDLPKQIVLAMCSSKGKPCATTTLGREFGLASDGLGRQLKVTLGVLIEESGQVAGKGKSKKGKQGGGGGEAGSGGAGPSSGAAAGSLGITALWTNTVSSESHFSVFTVTGFTGMISTHGMGRYVMTFKLMNNSFHHEAVRYLPTGNDELTYEFTVASKPPSAIIAHFEVSLDHAEEEEEDAMETDEPKRSMAQKASLWIRDDNPGITLILNLVDDNGNKVPFPSSISPVNVSEVVRINLSVEGQAARERGKKQVLDRGHLSFELSDDRQVVRVTRLRTAGVKISSGDSINASLEVDMDNNSLQLTSPLEVMLRAGKPTSIEVEAHVIPTSVCKGEAILTDTRFHLVDEEGNHFNPWLRIRGGYQPNKRGERAPHFILLKMVHVSDNNCNEMEEIELPFGQSGFCSPPALRAYGPVGSPVTISASCQLSNIPSLSMVSIVTDNLVQATIRKVHLGFDHEA